MLQYEEGDMYEHFRSFYEDVFPEFTTAGKILQFKVRIHNIDSAGSQFLLCYGFLMVVFCHATTIFPQVSCNYEPHLRGNVYVQYSRYVYILWEPLNQGYPPK